VTNSALSKERRRIPVPLTEEDRAILRGRRLMLVMHHLWEGSDRSDADLMCKAGHWRRDSVTGPIWFTGSLVPWPFEQLRIQVGGCVGRYV
jgi:hypothetical protein